MNEVGSGEGRERCGDEEGKEGDEKKKEDERKEGE